MLSNKEPRNDTLSTNRSCCEYLTVPVKVYINVDLFLVGLSAEHSLPPNELFGTQRNFLKEFKWNMYHLC
jgi:hypothetical protein